MQETSKRILSEMTKVIKGKDDVLERVLQTLLAGGHILLDDVPGVGKTTLALSVQKVLGLDYKRVQLTPDVIPSDILGFTLYDREQGAFVYQEGAVMCNLLLADELNRTSSRTQAALLEVMEEKQVTLDGKTHDLPVPFHVIATQNPIGSYGTQQLPLSQLDRFMSALHMGYPDTQAQIDLLRDRQGKQPLDEVNAVVSAEELLELQGRVSMIHVSDAILSYVTKLTQLTREDVRLLGGVSPRGALHVLAMARARAFMHEREHVLPEDVQEVFVTSVHHRLFLDPSKNDEQTLVSELTLEILASVDPVDFVEARS